jgi:hypothetical protein
MTTGSHCRFPEEKEPKLRHEFVGMMFAVAIGEIGLQIAMLVHYENSVHYLLPAYSHLLLATFVIAASWVGWTLSPSPGARHDVTAVFEVEFFVLLIDVLLVICYFVLARSVDLQKPEGVGTAEYKISAVPESFWVFIIFCIYLFWDFWTKIVVFLFRKAKGKADDNTWKYYSIRTIPTIVCTYLAWLAHREFLENLKPAQVVLADLALLSLVLLFRAGKDLISAFWPTKGKATTGWKMFVSLAFTISLLTAFLVSRYWALNGNGPTGAITEFIDIGNLPKDIHLSQ